MMSRLILLFVTLVVLFAACKKPDSPNATTRRATTEVDAAPFSTTQPARPVVAIWHHYSSEPPPGDEFEFHRLIVGIWTDGTVVWSDRRDTGGKPYRRGKVKVESVIAMLGNLETDGLFNEKSAAHFGPDASYTVIAAENGARRLWLGSWHDPPPGGSLVVTERGMGGSDMPPPSAEYVRFLKVWKDARHHIEGLIPAEGEAVTSVDERIFRLGKNQ